MGLLIGKSESQGEAAFAVAWFGFFTAAATLGAVWDSSDKGSPDYGGLFIAVLMFTVMVMMLGDYIRWRRLSAEQKFYMAALNAAYNRQREEIFGGQLNEIREQQRRAQGRQPPNEPG